MAWKPVFTGVTKAGRFAKFSVFQHSGCKRGESRSLILLLTIVVIVVNADSTRADTLIVPNYYLTIQEAIEAANPGDTVMVASGVYKLYAGNIELPNKNLTLRSEFGPEKTIIEGRGNGPVITIAEHARAAIDGFTIMTIKTPETRTLKGGGIYCAPYSSPTIVNNIITENSAVFGGGISCAHRSSPIIKNNVIMKNHAVRFGGGIFSYRASPSITNNSISENEASNSGGGIFAARDSSQILNNVIWKNRAKSGGGISCDRSACIMINNTVTTNSANYGGGIFFDGGSQKIINVILWQNEDDLYTASVSPTSRPDHSNIGDGDFRGVGGTIAQNPQFADPQTGNFRLTPDSPCRDAGNPDPVYFDPDGSRNDMGAHGGPGSSLGVGPMHRGPGMGERGSE